MRVVGYLRVSTDRQAEEGLGLEVQEQAIAAWAKAGGHKLAGIYLDEGVSGSNGIDTREGLVDAIAALKAGDAKGLVVYRLDRLARDLVVQETLLAELRRLGAEAFSTSAAEQGYLGDDPDDPSRALIRQILGAVSQYERAMIALRLRSGRRRKAERGGYAYGAPPYGWSAVDGELVADEGEQCVLVAMHKMAHEGMTLAGIARELNAEGVPPRRGERWHPTTVKRSLGRVPVA